jgi:hypothetical protein
MATYSLVHGSWHGGWTWDRVRAELERRGHVVHAPDLPCDDLSAGTAEYAACIPPADVVVGHSRGGLTISVVDAPRIYVCALVAGVSTEDAFVPGFGDACVRDELDRSYIVCTRDAAIEPAWQRRAAAAIGAEVVELDAGHSPMLTHPRERADLLERYAAS